MSDSNSNKVLLIIRKCFDVLGIAVPCISFIMIVLAFPAQIMARYVFHTGTTLLKEISTLGFLWMMCFGCGKAIENDEHAVCSLIYDRLNPKMQCICRILYNLVLVVMLIIIFKPCAGSLLAVRGQTAALKIPFMICFAPFMYMLAEIIVRSALNVLKAAKEMKEKENGGEKSI